MIEKLAEAHSTCTCEYCVKLCMYICYKVIVLCSPSAFREDAKKRYLQYTEQREQHLKEVKVNSMCTPIFIAN